MEILIAMWTVFTGFVDWVGRQPIDRIGHFLYILTLLLGVACIRRGHTGGLINLWELVTSTDRNGIKRTDSRKMFEVIGMSVMVITFYFLTVTGKLSEWYVLIFATAVVGGRIARDLAQIKQAAMSGEAKPQDPSKGGD